jgi:hypothetical protein
MIRLHHKSVLHLCALASACGYLLIPAPAESLPIRGVRIVADSYDFDEIKGVLTASGDVSVEFDGRRITAESVECRLSEDGTAVEAVQAAGSISFSETGDGYRLDSVCNELLYKTQGPGGAPQASLRRAKVEVVTKVPAGKAVEGDRIRIFAGAEEIELAQRTGDEGQPARVLMIRKGWVTTCDRPNPHYRIRAKELVVAEGDYVLARGASVQLWGLRLPSIPSLRLNLREAPRTSLFPMVGLNTASGAYFRWRLDLGSSPKALRIGLQVSQKRSPSWGAEGSWGTNPRLFWAAVAREDTHSTRKRGLTVSRDPQAGVEFGIGRLFLGTVDWGRFREFPGGIQAERARARIDLCPLRLIEAGRLALSASGSATRAHYAGGYNYRASTLDLQSRFDLGGGNSLLVGYVAGSTNRDTPFFFDDLDILRELQGGFSLVGRRCAVDFLARYDLDAHSLFAYRIGVSIDCHCLRPRFSYDSRDREFKVEMSLVGF